MTIPKEMEQQLLYHIDPSLQYRPDLNPNAYRKYTINAVSIFGRIAYIRYTSAFCRRKRKISCEMSPRSLKEDPIQKRVFETYLKMHTYQTVDFVQKKRQQYGSFDKVLIESSLHSRFQACSFRRAARRDLSFVSCRSRCP